ncbi:hypothetical protein WN944_001531 [Citrus x changshan-huyou]|uniref:Uncharacterized protein n=1 Tax=Citrus x changshan-huyou TaxID=2935761 RepID=A0AAP0MEU4_9ROSI
MDINFRLFSERLGRVLAGEEVTLPDAAKQPIQNLHAEVEIVTSWLSEFEDDISCLLMQKIGEVEIDNPDLGTVMDEINCFTYAHQVDYGTGAMPKLECLIINPCEIRAENIITAARASIPTRILSVFTSAVYTNKS